MSPASEPVDLTWNAPPECPARDVVLDEVGRVLSNSRATRVPVAARVNVSRDEEGRWHATLTVGARDARSDRALDAESCPAIASATAVIVALAVEGGMPEQPQSPAPSPAPKEAAAPTVPRGRASQIAVAVAGTLDGYTLPSPSPGLEAALGWVYSWSTWRIRVLGSTSFFLAQTRQVVRGDANGEIGHFDLDVASARACGSLVRDAFDFGPCVGAEIDWMTGLGSAAGPASPRRSTGSWPTILGSLAAFWSFSSHVAILARGEGFYAPVMPPDFVVSRLPAMEHIHVYQASRAGIRGELGVEVRFF